MENSENSVGEVSAITQDLNGFIWIGGSTGIARHQGHNFKLYKNDPENPRSIPVNYISDLYVDRAGNLWATTQGGGILKYDREFDVFNSYQHEPDNPHSPISNGYRDIYQSPNGDLWFTGTGGVLRYDYQRDQFDRFLESLPLNNYDLRSIVQFDADSFLIGTVFEGVIVWNSRTDAVKILRQSEQSQSPAHDTTLAMLKNRDGRIWLGHMNGVSEFLPESHTFAHLALPFSYKSQPTFSVSSLVEADDGIIWMASDGGGLLYLDPTTNEIKAYRPSEKPSSLLSMVTRSVFEDKAGNLWVGHYPNGLDFYDKHTTYFKTYRNYIRHATGVYQNGVWAFAEDNKGNLWVGTDGAGLVYFDRENDAINKMYKGLSYEDVTLPQATLAILVDSRGDMWLGSWADGVTKWRPGEQQVVHYHPEHEGAIHFPAYSVWKIIEDQNQDLWFATMNSGLIFYNRKAQTFTPYTFDSKDETSLPSNVIWSVFEDSHGEIWISTFHGLAKYNRQHDNFERYQHIPENATSLSAWSIISVFESQNEQLWIATNGGGLNEFAQNNQSFASIRELDGLANESVVSITESDDGQLWVATHGGLSKIDPETRKIENYTDKHWLQDERFNRGANLKLRSGEIVLGGVNGFSIFDPAAVKHNQYSPPAQIVSLEIFNDEVTPLTVNSPLSRDIKTSEHIYLDHSQSVFTLKFSSPSYRAQSLNRFQYKMVGFDSEWSPISRTRQATYTNLDAGQYTFKVRAYNNDGILSQDTTELRVTVLPPPWATWWAYTTYAICILGIVVWFSWVQHVKMREQKRVNDKLKELDRLRNEFIANTSHELRTPINGIIGLSEFLMGGGEGPVTASMRESLSHIAQSGHRLAHQVEAILHFSNLDKPSLKVNLRPTNINHLVKEALQACDVQSLDNHLFINNELATDLPKVMADARKLKHCFYQLLSNAIKYTREGSITLSAEITDREVIISIIDTGIGISQHKLEDAFAHFTQIAESGIKTKSGTGLGLAVTKQLVEQQGGKISVTSEPEKGTTFTITLPREPGDTQAPKDALSKPKGTAKSSVVESNKTATGVNIDVFEPNEQATDCPMANILVVDDETVNRMVLRHRLLNLKCKVYEVTNGTEALKAIAAGMHFDLILLDIMMPEITGIEVCKQLRKTYPADQLPIIFVSAKVQDTDIQEGYEAGGNDYIKKPVAHSELESKVANFVHH